MEGVDRLSLTRESRILLVIYAVDLLTTFWLVSTGQATEGNPVMSFYLSKGWFILVLAKATLSLLPLFVLEWCRRFRPQLVDNMLRFAIVAYLGIYITAFANLNLPHIDWSQLRQRSQVEQNLGASPQTNSHLPFATVSVASQDER